MHARGFYSVGSCISAPGPLSALVSLSVILLSSIAYYFITKLTVSAIIVVLAR